jgi:hypothetical protein
MFYGGFFSSLEAAVREGLLAIPDVDLVVAGHGPLQLPLFQPILLARTPSSGYARKHRYTPAAVRKSVAWARNAKLLPRAFSLDRLRTARVCNILLSSYNAKGDPRLDARFMRAIALLKANC